MHQILKATVSLLTVLAISTFCSTTVDGSPGLIRHPAAATTDLEERWSWGENEALNGSGNGWIGYAVGLWMEPNHTFFSSGGFTLHRNGKSFRRGTPLANFLGDDLTSAALPAINAPHPGQVQRTVAVLLQLDRQGQIGEALVTDLSLPIDLGGLPLAWLGSAAAEESFDLLTRLFRQTATTRASEDVVEAVGLHDRAAAVHFLARVLEHDERTSVREEAAEALAYQNDPEALDILQRTVRQDQTLSVREEAVEALGESRVEGAEAVVIELARHVDDRRLRAEAVETLADLGTPKALETIRDLLWNDSDVDVQEEALDALAHHGPEDNGAENTLELLIEVARHHPKTAIREEAVEALAEIAGDRVTRDRVVGTLEDLVNRDPSTAIREEALDALGELADGGGIAVLAKVASTHADPRLREEALDALAEASEDHPRARRALEMMSSY
ncbi:MAG: HEAT repeat domain-containing protein [Acidobacteriota bacterium]